MAEKTDVGRLTAPSILKLMYESMGSSGGSIDGKTSAEIWDDIELNLQVHQWPLSLSTRSPILSFSYLNIYWHQPVLSFSQKASASFEDPLRFRSFLVMDPENPISISLALRYWGCAIQAGARISGSFGFSPSLSSTSTAKVSEKVSPLAFGLLPYIPLESPIDWDGVINRLNNMAKNILDSSIEDKQHLVKFDGSKKTVTLFMPGFDKSEIKLYQVSHFDY